jgi:hypothetical protein
MPMRQKLSIVLIVIAALLVVGTKVVAPQPGLTRSYFTEQRMASECTPLSRMLRQVIIAAALSTTDSAYCPAPSS